MIDIVSALQVLTEMDNCPTRFVSLPKEVRWLYRCIDSIWHLAKKKQPDLASQLVVK
jgi:hypothetical protein